jgi:hypothetical protein
MLHGRAAASVSLGVLIALAALVAAPGHAQGPSGILRVTLLSQWTIQQHRGGGTGVDPALGRALHDGVVDRTVFAWQRGVIPRSALVPKPVRVVPPPEAAPLGGRGRFDLVAVRPPAGRAAWTEVEVALAAAGPDDVAIVEIGGERNTLAQVLETVLVQSPGGPLVAWPLAPVSLLGGGDGIPVVRSRFELPVTDPRAAGLFRDVGGLELLVVRSLVETVRDGGIGPSGPADASPLGGGDWREGDRVFVRLSARRLGAGAPALVLGWKDRTLQPDGERDFPRRSALPLPAAG